MRRNKQERSPDGTMSLMEHLHELRRRLFFAVLGLFVGVVLGFIWFSVAVPPLGIKSLGDILIHPYCQVPPERRVSFDGSGTCQLLANGPFSALQLRLKAALMAGAVISCPVWLYQLWSFVTPALYAKERKYAIIFVASAAVLMMSGAVLAYIVIQEGLTVLLGFGGETTTTALNPETYYSFLIAVLLIFGMSFLLPLLLIMLNMIGVVKGKKLAQTRRYSMFGLVVFAGLVVPGNDPLTMLALALALCLLYEVAVQVSKLHDKRKAAKAASEGFGDLDDDEASPVPAAIGVGAGAADGAAALDAVDPMPPPSPLAPEPYVPEPDSGVPAAPDTLPDSYLQPEPPAVPAPDPTVDLQPQAIDEPTVPADHPFAAPQPPSDPPAPSPSAPSLSGLSPSGPLPMTPLPVDPSWPPYDSDAT